MLEPLAARYGATLQPRAAAVDDPAGAGRRGAGDAGRAAAGAAARAAHGRCWRPRPGPRSPSASTRGREPGGEWHDAVADVGRRADPQDRPPGPRRALGRRAGAARGHRDGRRRAGRGRCCPGPVDEVPKVVSRLQIGGTDLPSRTSPARRRRASPVIWLNAALEHDRRQGRGAGRARRRCWTPPRAARPTVPPYAVRTAERGRWAQLCAARRTAATPSRCATPGFTEVAPGTITGIATPADAAPVGTAQRGLVRLCADGGWDDRRVRGATVGGRRERAGAARRVRHRHVRPAAGAPTTSSAADRRAGRAALHRPGHRVPVGGGAGCVTPRLAALDEALYARPRRWSRHHAMRRTLWVFGARRRPRARTGPPPLDLRRGCSGGWLLGMLDAAPGSPTRSALAGRRPARAGRRRCSAGDRPARPRARSAPGCRRWPSRCRSGSGDVRHHAVAAHTRVLLVTRASTGRRAAGPAHRHLDQRPVPAGAASADLVRPVASAPPASTRAAAAAELARRWLRAVRPGHRATDLQWWAGWTVATTQAGAGRRRRGRRSRSTRAPATLLPDDLDPARDPPRRRPRCCPGSTRRRWAGSSAASTSTPRTCRCCSTATATAGPRLWVDGRIVGGWAQRKDGDDRACGCWPTSSAEAREALQQQRRTTWRSCSATSASRPASRAPAGGAAGLSHACARSKPRCGDLLLRTGAAEAAVSTVWSEVARRRRRRAAWTFSRSSVGQNGGSEARRKPP